MATSRKRRSSGTPSPVPNLHFVMIVSTVALIMLFAVLYVFAPEMKAKDIALWVGILLGFYAGKLTNGYGKPMRAATPVVDAVPEEDPEEEDADA